MRRTCGIVLIAALVGVHLLLAGQVFLWHALESELNGYWGNVPVVACLTIGCGIGHVSLLALWAALGQGTAYVRLPLAFGGVTAVWVLETLWWTEGFHAARSAAWAVMFAVQALLVATGAIAGRWGIAWWRTMRHPERPRPAPPRFSLLLLFACVTAAAALLALGKVVAQWLGWSQDVLAWEFFYFLPIFGAFTAAITLVLLAPAVAPGLWKLLLFPALLVSAFLAFLTSATLEFTFGSHGGLDATSSTICQSVHAFVLLGTLPVYRLGLHLLRAPPESSPSPSAQ
jgi:hypothetical protein